VSSSVELLECLPLSSPKPLLPLTLSIREQASVSLDLVILGNSHTRPFHSVALRPSPHSFAYVQLLHRQTEIYILLFHPRASGSYSNTNEFPLAGFGTLELLHMVTTFLYTGILIKLASSVTVTTHWNIPPPSHYQPWISYQFTISHQYAISLIHKAQ